MSLVLIGIFVWLTVKQNVSADIANGSARISFLDVGQGDSALISLPDNKQILIDTGKSPDVVAKIKSKMPPFDNEIEKVFLSHPDNDHIGEMQAILNSFKDLMSEGPAYQLDLEEDAWSYGAPPPPAVAHDLARRHSSPVVLDAILARWQ